MTGRWDELLDHLAEIPRENGSPELERTASWISEQLRASGWQVDPYAWTAHPHETKLLGLAVLALGLAYWLLLRGRRPGLALAAAVLAPVLAIAVVEYRVPVFGGIGTMVQHNVVATLSVPEPAQRIILSAHYDTKTEMLDHVVRTPIQILAIPVFGLLIAAPLREVFRRRRGQRLQPGRLAAVAGPVAALYGTAIALTYSAGALLPERSPGALDDGAACAVLLRAAEDLAAGPPPERTEIRIVLFSGEELGAHGAFAWVQDRFAAGADLPTAVLNFELIGSSRRFLVGGEASLTRHYRPPEELVDLVDRALLAAGGEPVHRTRGAGLTDAVAFRAAGVPAVTLVGREGVFLLPRGMHGANDNRERIDPEVLELVRRFVVEAVRMFDTDGAPVTLLARDAPR